MVKGYDSTTVPLPDCPRSLRRTRAVMTGAAYARVFPEPVSDARNKCVADENAAIARA